jgi:hypothetical protein
MTSRFDAREGGRALVRFVAFALVGLAIVLSIAWTAKGQDHPNCAGWISTSCCCSNGCCSEVEPGEVEHLGGDEYRIVPSGQTIRRTGWSQDGRFMRCSCDLIDGRWVKHPKAYTRCLFPPMPNS